MGENRIREQKCQKKISRMKQGGGRSRKNIEHIESSRRSEKMEKQYFKI